MSKPGAGKQPRTEREFKKYATKRGGTVSQGTNHSKVTGPRPGRPVTLPRHLGDYGRSFSRSILAQLQLIGIAILLLSVPICLVVWLVVNLGGAL